MERLGLRKAWVKLRAMGTNGQHLTTQQAPDMAERLYNGMMNSVAWKSATVILNHGQHLRLLMPSSPGTSTWELILNQIPQAIQTTVRRLDAFPHT